MQAWLKILLIACIISLFYAFVSIQPKAKDRYNPEMVTGAGMWITYDKKCQKMTATGLAMMAAMAGVFADHPNYDVDYMIGKRTIENYSCLTAYDNMRKFIPNNQIGELEEILFNGDWVRPVR